MSQRFFKKTFTVMLIKWRQWRQFICVSVSAMLTKKQNFQNAMENVMIELPWRPLSKSLSHDFYFLSCQLLKTWKFKFIFSGVFMSVFQEADLKQENFYYYYFFFFEDQKLYIVIHSKPKPILSNYCSPVRTHRYFESMHKNFYGIQETKLSEVRIKA